jgi:hypothetical protein
MFGARIQDLGWPIVFSRKSETAAPSSSDCAKSADKSMVNPTRLLHVFWDYLDLTDPSWSADLGWPSVEKQNSWILVDFASNFATRSKMVGISKPETAEPRSFTLWMVHQNF